MDPIWSPTTIEIQTLCKPNVFTLWLYNKTLEKENIVKNKLMKDKLVKAELEHKKILEKVASSKAILINQTNKPKTEIRINNDGSICKFLG